MYKKSDFKVGDTLFCLTKKRHHLPYELDEYKIEKVGSKYIEVNKQLYTKIPLKNLKFESISGITGYAFKSQQEAEEFVEKENLEFELYLFFNNRNNTSKLTFENLKKIKEIIDAEE